MVVLLAEWQTHGVFMSPIYRLCVQIDIAIVAVVAACAAVRTIPMTACAAVAEVSVTAVSIIP